MLTLKKNVSFFPGMMSFGYLKPTASECFFVVVVVVNKICLKNSLIMQLYFFFYFF